MNQDYEASFWTAEPADPDSSNYHPVQAIQHLTPFGMMLASLASCTALILHSYAGNHGIGLKEVRLNLAYHPRNLEDTDIQLQRGSSREYIAETIQFSGDLSEQEERKLFRVAAHCPIEKIFKSGIEINSKLIHN